MINIRKLFSSFHYAYSGVIYALSHDQNLRVHIFAGVLVIIASIFFRVSGFEMGILGLMILLVMCSEMVNTAIEKMVDLITTEHRKEAKIAKDVAAGMVLVAVVGSVIVGILIFTPHIIKFFF